MTAEIAVTLQAARARAARIRSGMVGYLTTLAEIKAAYEERDWDTLGYGSWEAYVDSEFSEAKLRLSPEHRQKAVAELRLAGMSTRAIGSALGVAKGTVDNDLARLANSGQSVTPERVVSLDGRERPAVMPERPKPAPMVGRSEATVGRINGTRSVPATNVARDDLDEPQDEGPPLPGMPEGQERGDAFMAGIDAGESAAPEPERPRPPKWDPQDRRRHEDEVARIRDIAAAREQSKTIVTDVTAAVCVVVAGCRLGETGLVTREMITKLREVVDLLEGEL